MTHESENGRLPITAAVLAGGRSMRMGVDKTLLPIDGRTLVSRVCEAVADVCVATIVVTNRPEALVDAGLREDVQVFRDDVAYQGPLGGLATAMDNAATDWVLAVAADMPHVDAAVVRALWAARGDADIVVPVTEKGYEPLLALYRAGACAKHAHALLESGRRRLVALFPYVKVAEVPADRLRAIDPDLLSLVNVNTPEELVEVREHLDHANSGARRLAVMEVAERRGRALPSERPITVYLNDCEVATMQATPRDVEELAVGFLVAEGLLSDRDALISAEGDSKRGLVWVVSSEQVPSDLAERKRYLTSGCGKGTTFASVGHARGLEPVTAHVQVTADEVYGLMRSLADAAASYRDTGGMHAAGIGLAGALEIVREDVGRHNAVDKVIGRAWLDRFDMSVGVLVATGRISYEMAVKAAKARIPIVASRSAVTDLAADLAESLGITLAGYVRGGKLTIYTHPERVITRQEEQE